MTGRWKIRSVLIAVAVVALALGTTRLIWRAGLYRRAAEKLAGREHSARFLVKSYREEVELRRGLALSEALEEDRAWNAQVALRSIACADECLRRADQLAGRRAEYERAASRPWLSPRDPGDDWHEPSLWPESMATPTLPSDPGAAP